MNKKSTLYFVFAMSDKKTRKVRITDPREDLTKAEIEAAGKALSDKKAIVVKGEPIGALKDWYIENVDQERPE